MKTSASCFTEGMTSATATLVAVEAESACDSPAVAPERSSISRLRAMIEDPVRWAMGA